MRIYRQYNLDVSCATALEELNYETRQRYRLVSVHALEEGGRMRDGSRADEQCGTCEKHDGRQSYVATAQPVGEVLADEV